MSQASLAGLKGPVAVLMGGNSAERDVSLNSGNAVLEALKRQNIESFSIDPKDADWMQQLVASAKHTFIALHGPGGEDGRMQGTLENLGLSYTGSGVLGSALAMDKRRTKLLWQALDLPTPAWVDLKSDSDFDAIMQTFGEVMVKPVSEGSSLGMSRVSSLGDLEQAWKHANEFEPTVIAEQFVTGAEYTVAIINGQTLPSIRLETDLAFYDYQAKYISDSTRYFCPSGLSETDEKALQSLSLKAFNSLGCSGWGRVDFMRNSATNEFLLLEVNTSPGMTDHSLVPMAAKAAGLSFDQLVLTILEGSIDG